MTFKSVSGQYFRAKNDEWGRDEPITLMWLISLHKGSMFRECGPTCYQHSKPIFNTSCLSHSQSRILENSETKIKGIIEIQYFVSTYMSSCSLNDYNVSVDNISILILYINTPVLAITNKQKIFISHIWKQFST